MSFSSMMSAQRDRLETLRDNNERFDLDGGIPRKRRKYLVHLHGVTEGVVWERSGEVRTLLPHEYLRSRG